MKLVQLDYVKPGDIFFFQGKKGKFVMVNGWPFTKRKRYKWYTLVHWIDDKANQYLPITQKVLN